MPSFSRRSLSLWTSFILQILVCEVSGSTIKGYSSDCPAEVERDVMVVGGGSSGTYTSVRLHQQGKSVALVERLPDLGGNVETFTDPVTNQTFDYGVQLFSNISVARNYLASLGIATVTYEGFYPNTTTYYLDIHTGKVSDVPAPGNATEASEIYADQMRKYGDLFSTPGFFLPDPIPSDLLLPWGQWVLKYKVTAWAYNVFYVQAGNALQQLTLYIMKYYNLSGFTGNAVTTAAHGNQIIYNTAYEVLGGAKNVFLSSNIKSVTRTKNGVVAQVDTLCGRQTIKAKKLVVAIRPKYVELSPWLDVRSNEAALTKQFTSLHTWTCVLMNSGMPEDVGIESVDNSHEAGIPSLPATLGISSSGIPGVDGRSFWWATKNDLSRATAEKEMLGYVDYVQKSMNYSSPPGTKPVLFGLKYHTPYFVSVSAEAIAGGFYKKLNGLQGQYNTFWTGAAWESENSASIWYFSESVMLPQLLKSLG